MQFLKRIVSLFFSSSPKFYRIIFGPNRGKKIFVSYQISPRMLLGLDEPWLAKIAKLNLKKSDIVYDVGAHIGYTSLLFSKYCGVYGKVHAFELLPSVAHHFLEKTVKANHLEKRIFIHPIGLANEQKTLHIVVGQTMMGNFYTEENGTSSTEQCFIDTLDNYQNEKQLAIPQFIKVDIETAEIEFIKGAKTLINQYKPILLIEFHNIHLLKEGYHLLDAMGYKMEDKNGVLNSEIINKFEVYYGSVLAKSKN